jgi:hypothetical protein
MASKIKLKRSSIPNKTPQANQLEVGEVALNTADGKLFVKKDDGTVVDTTKSIFQRNTNITVNDTGVTANITATVDNVSKIQISGEGTRFTDDALFAPNKTLFFQDDDNDKYVGVQAPDNIDYSYIFKLPPSPPTDPSVLAQDGEGNTVWGRTDTFGGNRVYASDRYGNDANDGITEPVRSIKRAAQIAASLGQRPKVNPGQNFYNAKRLLEENRAYIQEETIAFINWNFINFFPIYDQAKCSRDVGLILNAVVDDIIFNTNFNSITAGLSYIRTYSSNVTTYQKAKTIQGINKARDLALDLVEDSTFRSAITARFDIITDIIDAVSASAAPTLTYASPINVSPNVINAGRILQENKEFLKSEVVAFVTQNDPPVGIDISVCGRDTGFIVDAFTYDLFYGGNSTTVRAATAYFYGTSAVISNEYEIEKTVDAYNHLKSLLNEIVTNTVITPTVGNTQLQDRTSFTAATSAEVTILEALADVIIDYVVDNESEIATTAPTYSRGSNFLTQNSFRLDILGEELSIRSAVIAFLGPGTYDVVKCERDSRLIIDAVGYDLALGTNYNSVTAGLSYTRANSEYVKRKQKIQTLGAINFIKTESAISLTSNSTAQTRSNAAFTEILDIIENGETAANALTFPEPTGVVTAVKNAVDQLTANRNFLKAEVTAYINTNFLNFQYLDTIRYKCERDLNVILDAAVFDIALGTNFNAVTAGLAYKRENAAIVYDSQQPQTVAGIKKAKALATSYLSASATAQTRNTAAFDEVLDILQGTVASADAITMPAPTGADSNVVSAKAQLLANKEFIKAEIIAHINDNSPPPGYNQVKCARDIGYIVDALAYDILYGGNTATLRAAEAYFVGAAVSQLGAGQQSATVAAFEYLQTVVVKIVQELTVTKTVGNVENQDTSGTPADLSTATIVGNLVKVIRDCVKVGNTTQLPTRINPSLAWITDTNLLTARTNLFNNIATIVTQTSEYITESFDNFTYNSAKCSRDVGYIVDALCYDVLYGGNSATLTNARAYYVGATSQLGLNQTGVTVLAYQYLNEIAGKVAQGITVADPWQSIVPQNTASDDATSAEATTISNLVTIINNVIEAGNLTGLPTAVYPSLSWVDVGITGARTALITDKDTIVGDTIGFIFQTYTGFTYNQATCKRDVGLIIDAVIYDSILGGNRRSVEGGLSYYEAGNLSVAIVVADQKPETIAANEFARNLALDIIQQIPVEYPYQNILTQKRYLQLSTTGAITSFANKFNIIINILRDGPSAAPAIVQPAFDIIPITIVVSAGDFYIDNPIIIPDKVSVVGDSLRSVVIRPLNANKDMFRVRNGAYLTGVTFRDGVDPISNAPTYTFNWAVAFDDVEDTSVDRTGYFGLSNDKPTITLSPYIQNCSIISFLGCNGVWVDGAKVVTPNTTPGLPQEQENPVNLVDGVPEQGKSMIANAFTMVSFGGTGWFCSNDGYAQIVSCFQIFCLNGSYCQSGGYLSVTNSATNFGVYALRSSGYSQNSFEFDRGVVAATGTSAGVVTFTSIGTKRAPVNQYVIRIKQAGTGDDITASFKQASSEVLFNAATAINLETDVITVVDHGFANGDSVYYTSEGNGPIFGLLESGVYFIQVITTSTFKIFNDNGLQYPVNFITLGTGNHKLSANVEEYFVGDTIDTHSSYQELTLEGSGPYFFNPGQTILGNTGGFTSTAFVLSYNNTTKKLIVSNEYTLIEGNLQRIFFTNSSVITSIGGALANIAVDSVIGIQDVYFTSIFKVQSTKQGNTIITPGNAALQGIHFHRPSIVNSSAHTWEFAGSGTDYNALPQNGGVTTGGIFEQYSELPGRVYSSGTNELGDFKVGDFIVAENKTGNITFRTRVTVGEIAVLKLSLSDIEVSEFSTDTGLGDNEPGGASNARISTQRAVRTFIANRLGNVIDKDASSNAVPGALVQLNSQGQINQDLLPPARGITTYNVEYWGGRLDLSDQIPAIQVISGDNASESYKQRTLTLDTAVTVSEGDVFTLNGNTGYGLVKEDYTTETEIAIVNVTGSFTGGGDIKINNVTQTGVNITVIGDEQTIVDNYFLKRDTSSQYLILSYGVTYDFTGITTITGANSGAQGTITSGPIYGVAYGLDATSLVGGTFYTPASGTLIYYDVALTSVTGTGTGARANITVANGSVTAVELIVGGTGYDVGDELSAASGDIGGTGAGFRIEVLRADTRLNINLTGNFIKFAATQAGPEYIEDANADAIAIANLAAFADKSFDSRDISLGGDVSYAASTITIIGHGYTDADAIVYNNGGNLTIGNLINQKTYWVKVLNANTIELYNNYGFTSGSKVIYGTSTTGTQFFRKNTVNTASNTVTVPAHGLSISDPIRFSAASVPDGVNNNGYYYVGSITTNCFTLHTNKSDALASNGGVTAAAVAIGSTGTGSATITTQNVEIIGTVNTSSNLPDNWGRIAQATFDATNIVSGVMSPSRLAATGSATDKTFLRGDSSWSFAVQNIRPVTGSPIGVIGDFYTQSGTNYYYNSIQIDVAAADDGNANPNFTNLGVVAMNKVQFVVEDGQATVKTGIIDAGFLNGQPGNYYTNPQNIVGVIPIQKGGTGLTTFTKGDIIYSGSNDSLTQLSIGAANTILASNGEAPSWSSSLVLGGTATISGISSFNSSQQSVSTTSGGVRVSGGLGVVGNAYIGGEVVLGDKPENSGATARFIIPFQGTAGTIRSYVELQGVNADNAGNENGGAFIKFRTAVATGFGPEIGGVRQSGGAGDFLIRTGDNAPVTRVTVRNNGNVEIAQQLAVTGGVQNSPIGNVTRNTGAFTTLAANNAVTFTANTASLDTASGTLIVTGGVGVSGSVHVGGELHAIGTNSIVILSPTGTGTVTVNPATLGAINNMSVGATTRSTGAFTTLTANAAATLTADVVSTTTGTGTLVVTGGVGVSGAINAGSIKTAGFESTVGVTLSAGTNIDQLKTVNVNLTLTKNWQDTGIKNIDLATGSYYIQIYANDNGQGGGHTDVYYSGIMSWYAGTTNETTWDEIVLNRAGSSVGSGILFVRLLRSAGSLDNLKLQMAGNTINTGVATYTFKFRRLI